MFDPDLSEPRPAPAPNPEPSVHSLIAAGRDLIAQHRLMEALACLDTALTQAPDHATVHFLRGETLFLLRRIEPALASYQAALRLGLDRDYDAFEAAMSGAVPGDFGWLSAMLLGRFEDAWQIADRTLSMRLNARRDLSHLPRHLQPVWNGESITGKHVLVRCYHGLGDTIHFARYLPLLKRRARTVSVQAQPELLPLLASLLGVDEWLPLDGASEPQHEVAVEVSDLAHILRTRLATIPATAPYLSIPRTALATEQQRLAGIPGFKIGIAWAAGAWKPERSIPLSLLQPLGEASSVTLISLQRGPERLALAQPGAPSMRDADRDSLDVTETAATIAHLDLVITVDTMVAHLAGALGIPVWLLLHDACDWRWLLTGERSPWYPTMRLFRQPKPGDWHSVIETVRQQLGVLAGRR